MYKVKCLSREPLLGMLGHIGYVYDADTLEEAKKIAKEQVDANKINVYIYKDKEVYCQVAHKL